MLCGLLVDRQAMARPLELISTVLPLTYAYDALRSLSDHRGVESAALGDTAVTLGMAVIALCIGALTLERRTA